MAVRPCSWLQIVGVRGHGDPPTETGHDVRALVTRLQTRLGPAGLADVVPFPYEQGPDVGAVPLSVPRDVSAGARALEQYVDRRSAACPGERLVVIGQSEGAAVAHLALPRIGDAVRAAVLLGDPLHLSGAPYNANLGPTPNGALTPWLGLGIDISGRKWTDPVPNRLAWKVMSYCLPHDQVCGLNLLDRAPNAHLDYRMNPTVPGNRVAVLDLAVSFLLPKIGAEATSR
jgi:pimeloyl-ACP methyl ester carboxylesterase